MGVTLVYGGTHFGWLEQLRTPQVNDLKTIRLQGALPGDKGLQK